MTSTAIYTCYRQLHPPTGVDHAVFASVTAPGSRDLVVAKASILELYRVRRDDSDQGAPSAAADGETEADRKRASVKIENSSFDRFNADRGKDNHDDNDENEASTFFLELAGTFPIAGNITSLAAIPVGGGRGGAATGAAASGKEMALGKEKKLHQENDRRKHEQEQKKEQDREQDEGQDILAVSFGPAKMALVAYDSVLGRLATLSMHNFDADAIGPGSGGVESSYGLASALKDKPATISSCDPAGRCLAAVVAGCQLVVLPTLRYVPRSVFLSEEARQQRALRRQQSRGGNTSAAAAAAASVGEGGSSLAEDAGGRNIGVHDEGSGDIRTAMGGANGRGSLKGTKRGIKEGTGRASIAPGREGKEAAGLANSGTSMEGGGARCAVSKPFSIELEEVGITG